MSQRYKYPEQEEHGSCPYTRTYGRKGGYKREKVDLILQRFACDLDCAVLFADCPGLTEEDIKASIAYAKGLVEAEDRRRLKMTRCRAERAEKP